MKPGIVAAVSLAMGGLGCAGQPVALGTRTDTPRPEAPARAVSAEACSFDLYNALPLGTTDRHERAGQRLRAQAGEAVLSDVRVEERWAYVLLGVSYCTTLTAVATGPTPPATRDAQSDWHISPRMGLSFTTGVLGVEVQYRHFGVAAGTLCAFGCIGFSGLKYYTSTTGDSWAFGPYYIWGRDDDRTEYTWGVAAEYRWRFRNHIETTIGFGLGLGDNDDEDGEDDETYLLPSFSVGYAF